MPAFPMTRIIPVMTAPPSMPKEDPDPPGESRASVPSPDIRSKNRRKRYLDTHPEYFSPELELADPLLYDRMVRHFQTAAERESEGRAKGYSGLFETDLMRAEVKREALQHPDPNATFAYRRGPGGEVFVEDQDEVPQTKEEGHERWRREMELRFIRGEDYEFDYSKVDGNEDYDDWDEAQDSYFDDEEPSWADDDDEDGQPVERQLNGETGIQDF